MILRCWWKEVLQDQCQLCNNCNSGSSATANSERTKVLPQLKVKWSTDAHAAVNNIELWKRLGFMNILLHASKGNFKTMILFWLIWRLGLIITASKPSVVLGTNRIIVWTISTFATWISLWKNMRGYILPLRSGERKGSSDHRSIMPSGLVA